MQTSSLLIAFALLGWLLAIAATLIWRPRRTVPPPLPTDWALAPRPVFAADERQVYRLLRDALPHHVVLAKLPLVRLCQPTDPSRLRYWFDLLGSTYVSFAICSTNGRVLAAIDLDHERTRSRRVTRIKQSVLAACRVRYLRCPIDHLPTAAEVQLLVPQAAHPARGAQHPPRPPMPPSPADAPAVAPAADRRSPLWQDSSFFQDSFFGADMRPDADPQGRARPGASEPRDRADDNGPPSDGHER